MPRISDCVRAIMPVIALLIFLSNSSAMRPLQDGTIQTLYEQAREAEVKKDYRAAAGYYEKILKLDPKLHPLRANLGLMLYLNRNYAEAAAEFRKALSGDANLYTAHLFLGLSLLEMNHTAEAIPHLERVVRDRPQEVTPRLHLARAYYLAERHQDALLQLQLLSEKQPDDPEMLYLLGRVHLKLSLAAYEQLKQKHGDHYRIYQLLGENYEVQGLNGPAIANYRKALERNPQARGIHLKLGDLYQASGEPDKALESYRQ